MPRKWTCWEIIGQSSAATEARDNHADIRERWGEEMGSLDTGYDDESDTSERISGLSGSPYNARTVPQLC
jgi:hypothetical protein